MANEPPPMEQPVQEEIKSESPCMDKLAEFATIAAEAAKANYNQVKNSELAEDAKRAAQKLKEKAAEYWESANKK